MKTDSELIKGLSKGKKEALSTIYDKYFQDLYFYLLKFSPRENLVLDAIHELFLDLWQSRLTINIVISIKGYLLVSARRKLFKILKESEDNTFGKNTDPESLFDFSPEDILIKAESNEINILKVKKAISDLPPKQKEAIYLKYYQNLSIDEISLIQGIKYQSVLNNLQRAYDAIRNNPSLGEFRK